MKKKVEAVIVERNSQGYAAVSFFRQGERRPKIYYPVTKRSVWRITKFVWANEDRIRLTILPQGNSTGWLATLRKEYHQVQLEEDHDDALPAQHSRGREKLFKD